jgi:ATP-dependent DNA helicase PIF1
MDLEYLKERAILTPTNNVADMINSHVVSLILEDERQYLNCDTVVKAPNTHDSYDLLYPIEFLNSLNGNNFPPHKLCLKREFLLCYYAISINLRDYVMEHV